MVARNVSRAGKFSQCTDFNDLLPNDRCILSVYAIYFFCVRYRWLKLRDASADLAIIFVSAYSENT